MGKLIGAVGGIALAASVALGAAARRWRRAEDRPGSPLLLPEGGAERALERPDGVRLAVWEGGPAGAAHTFVLAHGWTCDRRVWGPVTERLIRAGARVVVYDHRGHGRSTADHDDLSLEAVGDDLAAVLDELPGGRVVVAGHSMGGMAVQALLARRPDVVERKVAGVALVSTACDRQSPGRLLAAWNVRLMEARLIGLALRRPALSAALVRFTLGRRARSGDLGAVAEMFAATPPRARARLLAAIYAMDWSGALGEVRLPTVIVSGTRDLLTLPSRSRRLAELIRHARLVTLPEAGHMLPLEEPDRLAEILLDLAHESLGGAPRVLDLEHAS